MLPATSELGEIEEEGHRRSATGPPQTAEIFTKRRVQPILPHTILIAAVERNDGAQIEPR